MIIVCLCLVAITGLFVVGEIYFERDWPRSTIKGFLIAVALLVLGLQVFGQTH
jgi:hypothetical protein